MPEDAQKRPEPQRIQLDKEHTDRLRDLFPDATYQQAIGDLMDRFKGAQGDPSNCANTELWIKLDRLQEVLELLALTNIEIADAYRRQVGNELGRMASMVGTLADMAEAHQQGGQTQ